jgi:hypothetical protein
MSCRLCVVSFALVLAVQAQDTRTKTAKTSNLKTGGGTAKPDAASKNGSAGRQSQGTNTPPANKGNTPPNPVIRTAEVFPLPYFCIPAPPGGEAIRLSSPAAACPPAHIKVQAQNAVAIASELKSDTEFTLQPDGDNRIIIFIKCSGCGDMTAIRKAIIALARPPQDNALPYKTELPVPPPFSAANIANQVRALFPDINASSSGSRLLLSSSKPFSSSDLAAIKSLISSSPFRKDLPLFCLSGRLDARPSPVPGPLACPLGRLQPAANASAIATALAKDPNFTITAQGNSSLIVVCKKTPCDSASVASIDSSIDALAWPSPAYIEDIRDVPEGEAALIAQKLTASKPMGITADVVGPGELRLKSDTPASEGDVISIKRQYMFAGQAPPDFRLFYQLPSSVISAIAPPPNAASGGAPSNPSSASAAGTANAAAAPPATPSSTTSGKSETPSTTVTTKSSTSTSTPKPGETDSTPASTPASDDSSKQTAPVTTTTVATSVTPPAPQTPPAAPAPPATPTPPVGAGMQPFADNVVFTDTTNDKLTWQRIRLLTLLDLPRPEVLMNAFAYQASSPDGREILHSAEKVRDFVSAYNDALETSIQYGWDYLSREMNKDCVNPAFQPNTPELLPPGGMNRPGVQPTRPPCTTVETTVRLEEGKIKTYYGFFDTDFYDYITQKFVADTADCLKPLPWPEPHSPQPCLADNYRTWWGFCPAGKYCLGFTQAFQPVRPNLTSILMGAIASKYPLHTILATIGCMEGKYEVYAECFPDRKEFKEHVSWAKNAPMVQGVLKRSSEHHSDSAPPDCDDCQATMQKLHAEQDMQAQNLSSSQKTDCPDCSYQKDLEVAKSCIRTERRKLIEEKRFSSRLSCEVLDSIAIEAQERCGMPRTFPLSCFTIQSGQSFSSPTAFSTFTLQDLNELAEDRLADTGLAFDEEEEYGTSHIGLLRAAIADFLFNYKMSQEFPQDFVPYDLQHSAQELNAELNPLVVAFNQDVAAYSRNLSDRLEGSLPSQNHFFQLWRDHKSFLNDGIITVRGIGNVPSSVDTLTESFFDATQAQSLSQVLANFSGQTAGGSSAGATQSSLNAILSSLEKGTLNVTTGIAALAALTPQPTQAKIGRQMTFNVTPYTLPGASSAELQVQLNIGEEAAPSLYSAGTATGANDTVSRVARHNVNTRVRVESVKMFELSSFSALIQRPRAKLPLVPPFIEVPFIGNLASVPLPGAKEYHRSTAIVSAVIVPTAADLAYGIDFVRDRIIDPFDREEWHHTYKMQGVNSITQFSRMPIRAFHKAMVNCFASKGALLFPSGNRQNIDSPSSNARRCGGLDFRTVPPEF